MWILPLVGYLGMGLGFSFLTLAIASGLYYLSELVEEHTVLAKRVLMRLIYTVITIQTLLWLVDGFPFLLSVLSVISHIVYLGNMRRFPIVKLSDPLFISSCVLVLINHYAWFVHFSAHGRSSSLSASYYDQSYRSSFSEIASYFGLCVWLVPFALFVSLSASDHVLPTMGNEMPNDIGGIGGPGGGGREKKGRQGMAKAAVDGIRNWVGGTGQALGIWRGDRGGGF